MADQIHEQGYYFTILLSYVEEAERTSWHPTEKDGPFSVLSRGMFATREEAHAWTREHLRPGSSYELSRCELFDRGQALYESEREEYSVEVAQ